MPAVTVAVFSGAVSCERESEGPLGLTLTGRTAADSGEEELRLAFAGAAPADLPARLEDAVVEYGAPGEYHIASGGRSWRVTARSVHLHREVAQRFYRAIPGRPAPWKRRALFGLMLGLARTRIGIAVLRALRR